MMHAFITNSIFVVEPPKSIGWGNWKAPDPVMPEWANDPTKKKLFGVELAKGHASPFLAACAIFSEASGALWASINWINDPEVLAARDIYQETVELDTTLLDKDQFAAKILKIADDRHIASDDLIKYLELYAKVRGFLKPDNVGNTTVSINEIKVKFVKPEIREQPKPSIIIDQGNSNENLPSTVVKFVKAG